MIIITECCANYRASLACLGSFKVINCWSVLLLNCSIGVVIAGLEVELALDEPSMVIHVIHVEVLVSIVPANNVQEAVIIEDIVGERADLWKTGISLHQVLLDVETEAFLGTDRLVETAKDQDCLAIDRHAHGQIAGCPCRLRVEVDHTPHVVIDVIHLDSVSNLLLVKLSAPTEHIDILVVEDAAGS